MDLEANGILPVIINKVFEAIGSVWDIADGGPHGGFGLVQDRVHSDIDGLRRHSDLPAA